MFDLNLAQSYMHEYNFDVWLIYDFRGNNPVMWQVIGEKKITTRRCFLLIPQRGEPRLLVHLLDKLSFSSVPFSLEVYISWEDMRRKLENLLEGCSRVAMEYSPGAAIPMMSWVDGGTVDLVRSLGKEVGSSANIFQVAVASWTEDALSSHLRASKDVDEIKDAAFSYITRTIQEKGVVTEYEVQKFIMLEFKIRNMETEDFPVVAVNSNSANPHYMPTAQLHSIIKPGDWVLIDLWARYSGVQNVFADITWVGYVGENVPTKYLKIFEVVKNARDTVVRRLQQAWRDGERLQGWQLDVVARNVIENEGYGKNFIHRTGHSIGPGPSVHALGVNLDNLETHDTRSILPNIGFSVEPGIYMQEYGVRLEINVFIDPAKGPIVTTPLQGEVIKLV
jgi:Xaa-Pro aminopeptidase